MASGGAARRKPVRETDGSASVPRPQKHKSRRETSELDRVIHEPIRLAIVSALASVDTLTFNELKRLLDITDGNLSVHARRLEEAGFLACEKSFVGRMPRTEYRLTAGGRVAIDNYLNHMESLIRRVREG